MRRGTSNGNARGSSYQRAVRRQWLVSNFGDGHLVHCVHCDMVLTVDNVSSDRIIPDAEGGTYARDNIQPCCVECNSITGGQLGAARAKANREARR